MVYYIKGNYYFDLDKYNQLRLTGPQNHLLMGLTFPPKTKVKVIGYDLSGTKLSVRVKIFKKSLKTSIPVVTDVRSLRNYTEHMTPKPTFSELIQSGYADLKPGKIKKTKKDNLTIWEFIDSYTDENGKIRRYGVKIKIPAEYTSNLEDGSIFIKGSKDIEFTLVSVSNIPIRHRIKKVTFSESEVLSSANFSAFLKNLYKRSFDEIVYLLKSQKTSSFEYGTIFPRDWIESADLGEGDFNKNTIDYMYTQAMRHISDTGEAWHEDIIGSYREKVKERLPIIDRKMIDIEPHYIIGMNYISKKMILNKDIQDKLKKVAGFILKKAKEVDLITFKRMEDSNDHDYFKVGNWRDSISAFPGHKSPLAPYDVNCVFYPVALKVIKKYKDFFQIKEEEIDKLIDKWDRNKQKFRMYHPNDILGYAIALHGAKNKPLPVAHLDESYDLFYSYPSMEEVVSFSIKIIDPDFFYTPGGPILVANDEDDFNTAQYHGKVIWPKQVAFAVAGLSRQFRRGLSESWPANVISTIKDSIIKTCEASFRSWKQMKVVPELYYYDEKEEKARLYTDQENYEGSMSLVQLWSLAGLRRIMREYQYIKNYES